MKEKLNELVKAGFFNLKEAEMLYQELSIQNTKKSFKDFIIQNVANCNSFEQKWRLINEAEDILDKIKSDIYKEEDRLLNGDIINVGNEYEQWLDQQPSLEGYFYEMAGSYEQQNEKNND